MKSPDGTESEGSFQKGSSQLKGSISGTKGDGRSGLEPEGAGAPPAAGADSWPARGGDRGTRGFAAFEMMLTPSRRERAALSPGAPQPRPVGPEHALPRPQAGTQSLGAGVFYPLNILHENRHFWH